MFLTKSTASGIRVASVFVDQRAVLENPKSPGRTPVTHAQIGQHETSARSGVVPRTVQTACGLARNPSVTSSCDRVVIVVRQGTRSMVDIVTFWLGRKPPPIGTLLEGCLLSDRLSAAHGHSFGAISGGCRDPGAESLRRRKTPPKTIRLTSAVCGRSDVQASLRLGPSSRRISNHK